MSWLHRAVVGVAQQPWLSSLVSRHGMKLGAARFVAGVNLAEVMEVVKGINADGRRVTLDHLGEGVTNEGMAQKMADALVTSLDAIAEQRIVSRVNVSIKLTQLGLDLGESIIWRHMERIVRYAKQLGIFVRIDMENFSRLPQTLQITERLADCFGSSQVGTVVQSCLRDAGGYARALIQKGIRARIVKGAYMESPRVAFPRKSDVDTNFEHIAHLYLRSGVHVALATHDEALVQRLRIWIQQQNIPKEMYEFQMLYGIATQLQKRLVREGYTVRVYVPYGVDWYSYLMRRIAERPANAWFVLHNLFRK